MTTPAEHERWRHGRSLDGVVGWSASSTDPYTGDRSHQTISPREDPGRCVRKSQMPKPSIAAVQAIHSAQATVAKRQLPTPERDAKINMMTAPKPVGAKTPRTELKGSVIALPQRKTPGVRKSTRN
ncbi:MAG: hypothetical protein HY299_18935 [Verrucomicrobia bacterium]|nr:hypothetical protein [Verrucomicrobiota bacterium]